MKIIFLLFVILKTYDDSSNHLSEVSVTRLPIADVSNKFSLSFFLDGSLMVNNSVMATTTAENF